MHLTQLDAYGLTLAVESSARLRWRRPSDSKRRDAVLQRLSDSTMTHPQVWLWFNTLYRSSAI